MRSGVAPERVLILMSLTPDERAALARLDREVSDDPAVDEALRSFSGGPREIGMMAGLGTVAALAVGLVAVVALLAVSFVVSFLAFVVLVIGIEMCAVSSRWQRAGARLARFVRSLAQSSPES